MNPLSNIVERIQGLNLERALGLRPPLPNVAVEVDRSRLSIVRLKTTRGRGLPLLEGHQVQRVEEAVIPSTIFDRAGSPEQLGAMIAQAFDSLGIRPGRISLVLPDNLAKISLLNLPERPPSRRQLEEVIRFKLHRAVPFRFSEACLTYQVLPAEGPGVNVLVALVRRALIEQFEQAFESFGARAGMIDLCTPNLLNLCRERLREAAKDGGDVALLNCTQHYFSLLILRDGRLIFFRCKTYAMGPETAAETNGLLRREVSGSISYYREKLAGKGLGTILVRTVAAPFEEISGQLEGIDAERIEPVDPGRSLVLGEGSSLDTSVAQQIAPAVGAALGRG